MIRWRFVLTRVIVVVSVLTLLRWGLGPMVRYVTVYTFQQSTGARADVGRARVGLFPPRVQYSDVQLADPRADKSMRNAVSADSIDFIVDGDALLRRRWVVRQGRISGLQIGSDRESTGHLATEVDATDDSKSAVFDQWFDTLFDSVAEQAKQSGENLETVQTGKQIRERWEGRYASLNQRAKELESRVRRLRDNVRGIDNPLRDWPALERTLAEAQAVRDELVQVRQDMERIPDQMQSDMWALDDAKRIDLAKLDQYVPGDLAESQNFGIDLVTAELRRRMGRLREWVDGGRTLAHYTVVAPENERGRGETVDLLGRTRKPDLLIQSCEVSGIMRSNGSAYTMTGVLENVTHQPERLEQPSRARLKLEGPETLLVDYTKDLRSGEAIDRLTMHWPSMRPQPLKLSGGERADLSVAGGERQLWVQLESVDDQVRGRIRSKQVGVDVRLNVRGKAAGTAAAIAMNEALADIDQVEIDATFHGDWRQLHLELNTNLAPAMQHAVNLAVKRQIEVAKQKVTDEVHQAHREQTLALREWMREQEGEAQSLLASADQAIEEMSQKVLREAQGADRYLGKLRSNLNDVLR